MSRLSPPNTSRLVLAQIRGDRSRSVTMLVAVAVATAAFTVLTGAADTSKVVATNEVASIGPSAYDILVRPKGSQNAMERSTGQVRADFLSGIFGGITLKQYHQISAVPGVDVAAPVAIVGFSLQSEPVAIRLPPASSAAARQLLSVDVTTTTDRGLSHIPSPPSFIYLTQRPLIRPLEQGTTAQLEQPVRERQPNGELVPVCNGGDPSYANPYDAEARSADQCDRLPGPSTVALGITVPLLIEAVDPVQEAKLDGLDKAVVAGRYLTAGDGVNTLTGGQNVVKHGIRLGPSVPVIVSSRNYLDDSFAVTVRRLPQSAANAARSHRLGESDNSARGTGPIIAHQTIAMTAAYATLVRQLRGQLNTNFYSPVDGLWRDGPVDYARGAAHQALRPTATTNPNSVWKSDFQFTGYVETPADNRDTAYRALTEHVASTTSVSSLPAPAAVGVFDPSKIEPFDPLSHVPLGGYEPPQARPADPASSRLLKGRQLLPNSNLAGYLGQPPQMVTTLSALPALESSRVFSGDLNEAAPISAIRIRVAGVHGVGALSRARVNLVAQDIIDKTGLQVDITTGSSPSTRVTNLPAGQFGRPTLTIAEGWAKKGVALQILRAVDRTSLVLFILMLFVCGLFVLNATSAAVRARRQQFGVLACVGWSPRQLFASILTEQAIRGLVAGAVGVAIAVPVSHGTGLQVTWPRSAVAVAAATVLTMLAGFIPALSASRARPIDALRPSVGSFASRRAVRTRFGLALRNLLRTRARSLTAIGSFAFGICSTLLLIAVTASFKGQLAGDLLGQAVTIQVRGVDYAAVLVMLALGLFGIADVLYLGIRERASELATLRATGWSQHEIDGLIVIEGALLAFVGSILGAAGSVGLGLAFTSESPGRALVLAVPSLLAGVALGAAAAIPPSRTMPRRLASALAEE